MTKSSKKALRKRKRITFDLKTLDEWDEDYVDELLEANKGNKSAVLKQLVKKARAKKETEPEKIMFPPVCGWVEFDPLKYGDVCLIQLHRPVRNIDLKKRQLKNLRCDMCELYTLKRQEQKLLGKLKVPTSIDALIALRTDYDAKRHILLVAQKHRTLSPTVIAEKIMKYFAVERTPASISKFFERHPDLREKLKEDFNEDDFCEDVREKIEDKLEIIRKKKEETHIP